VSFGAARAHVVALFFFLCAFTHFMSSVLRGMGKPTLPMLVFLFCWCVMRVLILTITDQFVHTITTTYLVYPITWTLSSTVLLILYLRERRKI
jgi:Na+-driven multidrug efflux pump